MWRTFRLLTELIALIFGKVTRIVWRDRMEPAVNKEPLVLFPWRVSVGGAWSQVCAGGVCCALLTGRCWLCDSRRSPRVSAAPVTPFLPCLVLLSCPASTFLHWSYRAWPCCLVWPSAILHWSYRAWPCCLFWPSTILHRSYRARPCCLVWTSVFLQWSYRAWPCCLVWTSVFLHWSYSAWPCCLVWTSAFLHWSYRAWPCCLVWPSTILHWSYRAWPCCLFWHSTIFQWSYRAWPCCLVWPPPSCTDPTVPGPVVLSVPLPSFTPTMPGPVVLSVPLPSCTDPTVPCCLVCADRIASCLSQYLHALIVPHFTFIVRPWICLHWSYRALLSCLHWSYRALLSCLHWSYRALLPCLH